MDKRITFKEMLHTLISYHERLQEPEYLGQEIRLPIVEEEEELLHRLLAYQRSDIVPSDTTLARVVLVADTRPRRGDDTWSKQLYWFIKGVE